MLKKLKDDFKDLDSRFSRNEALVSLFLYLPFITLRVRHIYNDIANGTPPALGKDILTLGVASLLTSYLVSKIWDKSEKQERDAKKLKQTSEDKINKLPLEDWPAQDKLDLNEQRPEHLSARPYNQDEIVPSQ